MSDETQAKLIEIRERMPAGDHLTNTEVAEALTRIAGWPVRDLHSIGEEVRVRDYITQVQEDRRWLLDLVERLQKERFDLLGVKTKEGLLASEWLSRTATAEGKVERLTQERDDARANATILANSWENETIPPAKVLAESRGKQ